MVRCVTANLRHSPKAEDNVIQYRFQQEIQPQGHPGDVLLESAIAVYIHPDSVRFEVGKTYEISIEVTK
jgi:hypothetical protein